MNDFIKKFNLNFDTYMYCVEHDVSAVIRWDTYRKHRIVRKKNTQLNKFEQFINYFISDNYCKDNGVDFLKNIFYGSNEFSPANRWIDLTPSAFIDISKTINAEYEKWERVHLLHSHSVYIVPMWIPLKQPYGERTAVVIDKNFVDILNNIEFAWFKYTKESDLEPKPKMTVTYDTIPKDVISINKEGDEHNDQNNSSSSS